MDSLPLDSAACRGLHVVGSVWCLLAEALGHANVDHYGMHLLLYGFHLLELLLNSELSHVAIVQCASHSQF